MIIEEYGHPVCQILKGGKQMSKTKTVQIGRNAGTGKFETVKQALKHPKTSVVETIKKPKK